MTWDPSGTESPAANSTMDNLTNVNSTAWPETEEYNSTIEALVVPILFGLIFLVGVVGNGTLIFTVLRNKKMRNTPNIFIVSLACGDLLLIVVSIPFTALIYTMNFWPYGQFVCKLNEFLQYMSLGVSVFTLIALSGDRYTAIVYPMKKHQSIASVRTVGTAVAIWVLAFILAVPKAVMAHVTHDNVSWGDMSYCHLYPENKFNLYAKIDVVLGFLIYFLSPMLIIASFYILMAHILVRSYQHMPGEAKGQGQKQQEARRKVAQIVVSFVLVFVACWLPRHIFLIWYHLLPGDYNLFWHIFKIISFCLTYVNSCLNPLALYFLSRQFRNYYNQYLCCCVGRWRRSGEGEESQCTTMYKFNNHAGGNKRPGTSMTLLTSQTVC